jgi:hypothetical protein
VRVLLRLALPAAIFPPMPASAPSSFNGTWKVDVGTLPYSAGPFVWLLRNGMYECRSCRPPIRVSADGHDQKVSGQPYDTISVAIVDSRTIREIEEKNGQMVSDEKFTVSVDGQTATDEFGNWKISMRRIAYPPPGSHLLSGTWKRFKLESTADRELLFTLELDGDTLSMSRPNGQSFRAKLNGPEVPYVGQPRFNGVSVKRINANTLEETDKFNGKVLNVSRMTISPDSKSINIIVKDPESGTTVQPIATRQQAW